MSTILKILTKYYLKIKNKKLLNYEKPLRKCFMAKVENMFLKTKNRRHMF